MANPFDKFDKPSQGAVFQTNPNADAEQAREDERLRNEAERLRIQQQAAARADANDAEKREEKVAEQAQRERMQASAIADSLYQMRNVVQAAREAKEMGASGSGIGSWEGTQGFRDGTMLSILGANTSSNDMQGLLDTIGSNTAFDRLQKMRNESPTGGALGAVSEVELRLLKSSIASLSQTQSEKQFTANMDKIIAAYTRIAGKLQSADAYYRENGSMDGFVPPDEDELAKFSFDGGAEPTAAGAGATQTSLELPQEYQDRHAAYLRQNWGSLTPEGYAQFRAGLDNDFPEYGSPNLEAYRDIVPALNQMAADGKAPEAAGQVPPAVRDLSGLDQFRNDVISNPWGTAAASTANAIGFGIPDAVTGNRLQAAAELNPTANFVGDFVGGSIGSALSGVGLAKMGAGRLAPLLGDVGYGTVYGATSDDDIITGALAGGLGAFAGDQAGKFVGRGINYLRLPETSLSEGQRAIAQTVREADNQNEVAAALTRADELGVPMTLADASPELQSLAGSAVRFSPTTAGTARSVMAQRNQGQLDRLTEAVARDLGPVENIPQRSADLLAQARTNAGPLYDQAYAAPGADMVDLTDLADRPTFEKALREAYNEVLDEGLDPSAAGIVQQGDSIMIASPSWQSLDYAKRGLDNIIERGIRQGDMPEVRRAQSMKNTLLQRMDEVNPAYAEARRAYAGPAQERAFLEQGQQAIRTRPDELSVLLADLTPEQRQQMQLGFQSEIMGQAGNLRSNSNPWAQINTPNAEGRMNVLYDGVEDADVARLLDQRDLELQLAGSANRLIGNSATAEREIADEFFKQRGGVGGDVAMGIVETGALGGPWLTVGKGIADRAFKEKREAAAAAANRRLADELGPLLLDQTPKVSADALSEMMAADSAYTDEVARLLSQGESWGRRIGTGLTTAVADRWVY